MRTMTTPASLTHAVHNGRMMAMAMAMTTATMIGVVALVCGSFLVAWSDAAPSSSSSSSSSSSFENHLLGLRKNKNNSGKSLLRNRFFALRHGQSKANIAGIIASDPTTATKEFGLSEEGKQQAKKAAEKLVRDYLEEQQQQHRSSKHENDNEIDAAPVAGIVVVTSDFTRAFETASILVRTVLEHNANVQRNNQSGSDETNKDTMNQTIPLWATDPSGKLVPLLLPGDNNNSSSNNGPLAPSIDVRLRERWFGDWDGTSDAFYQTVWDDDATDPFHTHRGVESVWSVVDRSTALVRDWDNGCHAAAAPEDAGCLWVVCVAHGDVLQILQTAFCGGMDPSEHRSLEHLETATLRAFEP